jgi:PTS system nitrogen regulatory IIA component
MNFTDFLIKEAVRVDVHASSKKALIQELARLMGEALNMNSRDIFNAVMAREKLGATGVGGGVAIPHARMEGLEKLAGTFIRLAHPIDFEAADEQPADLVFLLLTPDSHGVDHLKALARVARELRQDTVRARLRSAANADAAVAVLEGEAEAA